MYHKNLKCVSCKTFNALPDLFEHCKICAQTTYRATLKATSTFMQCARASSGKCLSYNERRSHPEPFEWMRPGQPCFYITKNKNVVFHDYCRACQLDEHQFEITKKIESESKKLRMLKKKIDSTSDRIDALIRQRDKIHPTLKPRALLKTKDVKEQEVKKSKSPESDERPIEELWPGFDQDFKSLGTYEKYLADARSFQSQ